LPVLAEETVSAALLAINSHLMAIPAANKTGG
jgi:hypothetical protein